VAHRESFGVFLPDIGQKWDQLVATACRVVVGRCRRRADPVEEGGACGIRATLLPVPGPRPPIPQISGWTIGGAHGAWARGRGLLGRRHLPPRDGLWLRARSVHTVGMRMALDLVWLDAAGVPVRTDRDVRPGRVRTCLRARGGVVEVAAGSGPALAAALRPPEGQSSSRSWLRLREPR
jgi:hypothetical protein